MHFLSHIHIEKTSIKNNLIKKVLDKITLIEVKIVIMNPFILGFE